MMSRDQWVRTMQAVLEVPIDGIWGPVTNAAYMQRLRENAEADRQHAAMTGQYERVPGTQMSYQRKHVHQMIPVKLLLTGEHVADLCATCGDSASLLPEPKTVMQTVDEAYKQHDIWMRTEPTRTGIFDVLMVVLALALVAVMTLALII